MKVIGRSFNISLIGYMIVHDVAITGDLFTYRERI